MQEWGSKNIPGNNNIDIKSLHSMYALTGKFNNISLFLLSPRTKIIMVHLYLCGEPQFDTGYKMLNMTSAANIISTLVIPDTSTF